MTKQDFMNESMDYKKMFLCFKKALLWVLAAPVAGAIVGAALYFIVYAATAVEYQAESHFYMRFAQMPDGDVADYYNGYTWNSLLHTDAILDYVVAAIVAEGSENVEALDGGGSVSEIKEILRSGIINGRILSDVRLLSVTFTASNPAKAATVQRGVEIGLPNFAAGMPEFASFELISSTAPQLVLFDNYIWRAAAGMAALFLVLALFAWWFYFILDDSLYTVADVEKRYPYPALGILLKGEEITDEEFYFAETKENLTYFLQGKINILYLSAEQMPYPKNAALRTCSGVVLTVPFARRNGKAAERYVTYLRNMQVEILGVLITEADAKFLKAYYGTKKVAGCNSSVSQ
jgi:capsular polysaccharide biosynthesis protein